MDNIAHEIWSETAVLELLGLKRNQLMNLRAKHGFPVVRLARGVRVYLAGDILTWVRSRRTRRGTNETEH